MIPARRDPRRRLRRRWRWLALAVAAAAAVTVDRAGLLLLPGQDDVARYHGVQGAVVRIISPHTLEVALRDPINRRETTRIRLIGLNAPLPAGRDRPAERGAEHAMQFVLERIGDSSITLELEPHRTRDAHGRVLAHVLLPEGDSLNRALLAEGLARTEEHWPHARLAVYAKAQQTARRQGRGIWNDAYQ